jgi:hypothetical protein
MCPSTEFGGRPPDLTPIWHPFCTDEQQRLLISRATEVSEYGTNAPSRNERYTGDHASGVMTVLFVA